MLYRDYRRLQIHTRLTSTIAGVLEHIHENWEIMTKEDCLPVHVALQLMDYSSLGRGGDYKDFQKTSKQLQKALKAIVNGILSTFRSAAQMLSTIRASPGLQQFYWNVS